jgi:hypothetical protein
MLPEHDDMLLAIFDFFTGDNPLIFITSKEIEAWQPLVHVCRDGLNLQHFCTSGTLRDALACLAPPYF